MVSNARPFSPHKKKDFHHQGHEGHEGRRKALRLNGTKQAEMFYFLFFVALLGVLAAKFIAFPSCSLVFP
ncbi:MAG: hypothetical protein ACREUQ_06005, partial [Burkholderiales bacterium]